MVYRLRYHRIIDLRTFRILLEKHLFGANDIVILSNTDGHKYSTAQLLTEDDDRSYFRPYADYKVISGFELGI